MLSRRIINMKPSMTIGLADKIAELKRDGVDLKNFSIGEPDFNTPQNVIDAAKRALDDGFTKYTVVSGVLELREAICNKLKNDNNVEYTPNQIIVSTGAKQSLVNTMLTICDDGDEVILPTPCWVSYIEMIKLAEAKPVLVPTEEENGFILDIDKIKEAITEKTKAILINTPNNPTGAVYSEDQLRQLGELAVEHNFYIISDEIYEKLIYDGKKHISIASLSDAIKEKAIIINGFSKAYAMTGWRLGYAAGPRELIKGMSDAQGHMTSAPNSIAQMAGIEALTGPQDFIERTRQEYDKRRKYLLQRLNNMIGVKCVDVKGAFYLMPDVSGLYGKKYKDQVLEDSIDVANYLLEEAHIAVVPGIAFEAPNNIRICYAVSMENIVEGIDRMEKAIKQIYEQ